MENEKMQINLAPGMEKATIKVIELDKENVLPVLEPLKVSLSGTIGSVAEFLKRESLNRNRSIRNVAIFLWIARIWPIKLITNETDGRNKAEVQGSLAMYPKFVEFGINSVEKTWEPAQLSRFIKMNRAFFTDIAYNMELVSILKNFKASIDSKLERSNEDNGSRTDNYSQVVNSNLPAAFNLNIPIFKGRSAEVIEVEIIADVDGRNIRLSLCSPGAEVVIEQERNKAIDEQLKIIRELTPEIPIIEQ